MNNPEYIVVDEFATVVAAVRQALLLGPDPDRFSVLNYQYGYITELNETLTQWSKTPQTAHDKYPLVWLEEPFTITRGRNPAIYGSINSVRVFIIQSSTKDLKAARRMTDKFKPVIYPIYRELLTQLDLSLPFSMTAAAKAVERFEHDFTNRYWWGDAQQAHLNDVVDCSIVTFRNLTVNNNLNCTPLGMLKS